MKLTGFLSNNDVNTIKLTAHNVKLCFEDGNVGNDKPLTIQEGQFELEGENSFLYTLDESSIPQITSSILKRPVNVSFYIIQKEYDGTVQFDPKLLRYQFTPTTLPESGIVVGDDNIRPFIKVDGVSVTKSGYLYGPTSTFELKGHTDPSCPKSCIINVLEDSDGVVTDVDFSEGYYIDYPYVYDNEHFQLAVIHNENVAVTDATQFIMAFPENNIFHENQIVLTSDPNGKKPHARMFELTMKYETRTVSTTQPESKYYTESDIGKILFEADDVAFESADPSDTIIPLVFTNPRLTGGPAGDASMNYELGDITAYGIIKRRPAYVKIKVFDKVYDGTDKIKYDTQLLNILPDDEVYFPNDRDILVAKSKNAGTTETFFKYYKEPDMALLGPDARKYELDLASVYNIQQIKIAQREVSCKINFIRFVKASRSFEISYYIDNLVGGDEAYVDIQECMLTTPNGDTLFLRNLTSTTYYNDEILWNSEGNPYIRIQKLGGSFSIESGKLYKVSEIYLQGKDSSNYKLMNNECENVPLYIVDSH